MYLAGPDSLGSWLASWKTGWGLLNYPMADIYNLEKETLRELQRVHRPRNAGVKVTLEGQGHPNLTVFVAHLEK